MWCLIINKGNNKITELEQSYKGKVKTHKYINRQISQQPENCENRNDPDLVQTFLKKWWVESDFKAPNLPLSLRLKGSAVTITVFITILEQSKIVVKAVPNPVKQMSKTILRHTSIKKYF